MNPLSRPSRTCLLALGFAVLVGRAPAADDVRKPDADNSAKSQPNLITVDFPGGTVAQFITTVAKAGGSAFNLLGEPEDLATKLPPFSVRNVTPIALAMGLRQLLEPRGFTLNLDNNEMFVLRRMVSNPRPNNQPIAFESFQVGPFLDTQTIDDIVAAMRAAWELNPGNKAEELQLKFHPPTKLLLASGTPEAIRIAAKVLSTLAKSEPKAEMRSADAERARLKAVADQIQMNREKRAGSNVPPNEKK